MKKRLMVGLLSTGLLAAMLPGVAAADSWECVGVFSDGPFTEDIVVPFGEYCALWKPIEPVRGDVEVHGGLAMIRIAGAQMRGDVTVKPGGQVNLGSTHMYGDIECEYPGYLWLYGSTIVQGDVTGCIIIDRR
jgi:hypothetical protein